MKYLLYIFGGSIIATSALSLYGRLLDISILIAPIPEAPPLQLLSAVLFFLSGMTLLISLTYEKHENTLIELFLSGALVALATLVGTAVLGLLFQSQSNLNDLLHVQESTIFTVSLAQSSFGGLFLFSIVILMTITAMGQFSWRGRFYRIGALCLLLVSSIAVLGHLIQTGWLGNMLSPVANLLPLPSALLFLPLGMGYLVLSLPQVHQGKRVRSHLITLKTRLAALFSLIALAGLLFMSFITSQNQSIVLTKRTTDHLTSIATVQELRLNETIEDFLQDIDLIASRTQLRLSLREWLQSPEPDHLTRMNRILEDVLIVTPNIESITLLSPTGQLVVSTDPSRNTTPEDVAFVQHGKEANRVDGLLLNEESTLTVRLLGPIFLDGELLGVIEILSDAAPILNITNNYSGLGETGEVILAQRNRAGDTVFLTPLRFDAGAALQRAVPQESTRSPMNLALQGKEQSYASKDTLDYRGVPVIAVTRYIESLDWGIVTKMDRSEALSAIRTLTKIQITIAILTATLVMITVYLITRAIIQPLDQLRRLAQNLQRGNFSMHTEVHGDDEIGYLAQTLNDMATQLQDRYKDLEEKVAARTKELQESERAILAKAEDLDRLNRLMVGRELRMLELKQKLHQETTTDTDPNVDPPDQPTT